MLSPKVPRIARRSTRKQFMLISAFCLVCVFANYIRNIFQGGHTTNITVKTFLEPITIMRTTTAWLQPSKKVNRQLDSTPRLEGQKKSSKNAYKKVSWEDHSAALKKHKLHPNGLLEVNPDGRHPIYDLIEKSEAVWKAKLKDASRSLHEAVIEYEQRYGRKPPLGFDKWWEYVEENDIQLPDEYDQINRDLEAFWGIDPRDLQIVEFMHEVVPQTDTYTLGKLNMVDPITLLNYSLPHNTSTNYDMAEGGKMIVELLREAGVDKYIPPFRATFNPHDSPEMLTNRELWSKAVAHAKEGKTFSMLNSPRPNDPHHGWLTACDPSSPASTTPFDFNAPYPSHLWPNGDPMSPSHTRTFIHDHRAAMDPCQNPHLLRQHGQFVKFGKGVEPRSLIIPILSFSPSTLHHDIISANPMNWIRDLPLGANPAWEEKIDERLHWRGANTGIHYSKNIIWRLSHRVRMMEWASHNLYSGLRILGLGVKKDERIGEGTVVDKARWVPAMLDIAFTGEVINCEEGDGTCGELRDMFEWRKRVSFTDAGKYKYILDIDGNAWSSRFKRLITSSSCIFKATVYPEWFTDRIQPWVHYVPVQIDLSDLWDSFAFFRGDLNGDFGHDDLAKKIGEAGRVWSHTFWRKEDIVAYNFRLLLEYARVMSTDREAMSFNHWASKF
ncbi:glycosyl transferase family 90-domain-containing protein [Lentinula detonsa]|uniref:Glycosyl transferase family 90-domain-containing protein n=1 Tax=Lentinula detonsa TaxID=2804962 RepID=A0AA38UYR4_9AGAR|nr:glycosyl transferase family 90-domain-containing protein [Lentinula detonsa]